MPHTTSRLSTLHKVRAIARDERRRRLAEALQAEAALDNQASRIEEEKNVLQQARQAAASVASFDLNRLADAQRFGVVLTAEQSVLDNQRATLTAEIERRRQALVHADCEVRAVERLQQKQIAREQLDQTRSQNRQLDETAITTFIRRKV